MTSASSMHVAGHPKPVLWDNPEGRVRREVRGGSGCRGHVYWWPIHVDVWQKPSQYCNYPPVKTIKKNKMWYIYTMEYYSAIKKNLILPFATIWVDLESIMLSEISQREKDQYSYVATYLWILKINVYNKTDSQI